MNPSLSLARHTGAEALAAFGLVFAGCGAIIANQHYHGALGTVGIALVFGLIIMGWTWSIPPAISPGRTSTPRSRSASP